jgi:FixJ family two-component response regulator
MSRKTGVPLIGIVDDDKAVGIATCSLLRSAGYECAFFESAEEFLKSGRTREMDCLVTDIQMPGVSGLELQRLLLEMNHTIPIIFASAHATDEIRARVLEQGGSAFLRKPFTDNDLLSAIQSALQSSEH